MPQLIIYEQPFSVHETTVLFHEEHFRAQNGSKFTPGHQVLFSIERRSHLHPMQDLESLSRLEIIEQLAGINYGPREIAVYLNEEIRAFNNKWEEKHSPDRQAYDRG